jgi:tRNA(Ile)-lysidine synthase
VSQIEMAVRRVMTVAQGERVLIGVSGGLDSLVLLHAALTVRRRLDIDLMAATLDHGLRGPDGAADADHVVRLSGEWGVPCVRGALSHGALDSTGIGIEAAARTARYTFLAETARSVGAKWVAVGHHADDQAETVLAHLIRGAGLDGLAGMRAIAPLPGHADLHLLRPLLTVRRAALAQYAARYAIIPRHDATNDDPAFIRNRIRHDLIPRMAELNAGIVEALVRLADNAALDADYLHQTVNALLTDRALVEIATPEQAIVSRAVLARLHPALARRLLMRLVEPLYDPARDDMLTHERLSAMITQLDTGKTGDIDVGGGVQVQFSRQWIAFKRLAR